MAATSIRRRSNVGAKDKLLRPRRNNLSEPGYGALKLEV